MVLEFEGPDGFYELFYPSQDNTMKDVIKKEIKEEEKVEEIHLDNLTENSFISKNNIQLKHLVEELIERKKQTIEYIKLLNVIYMECV